MTTVVAQNRAKKRSAWIKKCIFSKFLAILCSFCCLAEFAIHIFSFIKPLSIAVGIHEKAIQPPAHPQIL